MVNGRGGNRAKLTSLHPRSAFGRGVHGILRWRRHTATGFCIPRHGDGAVALCADRAGALAFARRKSRGTILEEQFCLEK